MEDRDIQRLVEVLEELRNNQQLQLERQAEAVALQREHLALLQKQHERAERMQDRAEQIQDRSAQLVSASRKAALFLLPVVFLLLIYITWILLRWGMI